MRANTFRFRPERARRVEWLCYECGVTVELQLGLHESAIALQRRIYDAHASKRIAGAQCREARGGIVVDFNIDLSKAWNQPVSSKGGRS